MNENFALQRMFTWRGMSSQKQRTTQEIKQKVNPSFEFYVKIFQYMYRLHVLFLNT